MMEKRKSVVWALDKLQEDRMFAISKGEAQERKKEDFIYNLDSRLQRQTAGVLRSKAVSAKFVVLC